MIRQKPRLPRLYSVEQIADLLGVSTKTVRRRIAEGKLLAHRVGRQVRISEDDYRSYVAAGREWVTPGLGLDAP